MLDEQLAVNKEAKIFIPDLSTHVLDISNGLPAPNVHVKLFKMINNRLVQIGRAFTDKDGRIKVWRSEETKIKVLLDDITETGTFALVFEVGEYFKRHNKDTIYPSIHVQFEIKDSVHHHIPIVVSPFGYSTYKGS